jgi:hypothetical protein
MDSVLDAKLEEDRKFGEQDGIQDPKCYPKLDEDEPDTQEEYKFEAKEPKIPVVKTEEDDEQN